MQKLIFEKMGLEDWHVLLKLIERNLLDQHGILLDLLNVHKLLFLFVKLVPGPRVISRSQILLRAPPW